MEGYVSLNDSTILQAPQGTQYVNVNYERGDNIASLCAIQETINASTNDSGSLLYFVNDSPLPASTFARNYESSTDGTRGATIILDSGAIFLFRQVFIDYTGVTSPSSTISLTFSHSQDGVTYTTIATDSFAINTTRTDNMMGQYILARYFKLAIVLNVVASQGENITLGKIRLVL